MRRTRSALAVIFSASLLSCDRYSSPADDATRPPPEQDAPVAPPGPVRISMIRNHESTYSVAIHVAGGSDQGGWSLVQVGSKDPDRNGKFHRVTRGITHEDKPLDRLETLKSLTKIEALLKDHYGGELDVIRSQNAELNALKGEEMKRYLNDPQLSSRLDSHYMLEIIDRYRAGLPPR